jgi:enterochelin esterase-like enzyme
MDRLLADPGQFATFRAQVVAEGTPLVEPDEDRRYRLVTFLYLEEPGQQVTDVLTIVNTQTDMDRRDGDINGHLMRRVPGTPLWYRSYRMRADLRATYAFLPCAGQVLDAKELDDEAWGGMTQRAQPDPHNPLVLPALSDDRNPASVVELTEAPAQPWLAEREGVPRGTVTRHRLGSKHLGNERDIWVHAPAGDGPHPLLVLFDGDVWADRVPIWSTLDNLIAGERLPPMVTVAVDSMDHETRWRELFCHEPFLKFLSGELLPWVADRWPVTETPERTILAGQSAGGLTAAFAALRSPDRFGNVLSQSGSYWWRKGTEFDVDAEWLTREYVAAPRQPIRFYLEAGLHERLLLRENRHLRDVLLAKGYDVSYAEYNGGHDYACWRGGLADGLLALTAGWSS